MANTQPVPSGVTKTEPAVAIGTSISGILSGVFLALKAFDVPITDDMSSSLTSLVLALCAVPAISGWLTRFFVYSPASAQKIANEAAATSDATIAPPPAT